MKYSKEFKLECVMKYKNGEHIKDPPGTKHKTFHDQVLNGYVFIIQWAKLFIKRWLRVSWFISICWPETR